MSEQQQPSTEQAEAGRDEYRRLWDVTVATLTAAVRLNHPQSGAVDFSDFLASALGAVAGNVGSTERITAGRPGSWESNLLAQLVTGTVGYDDDTLAAYRTEPVVVRLNVAQLVQEAYEDSPTEQRAGMLVDMHVAIDALPDPWRDGREPTEGEEGEWEAAEGEVRRRYAEAFDAYGRRFTAAVLTAAQSIEGLSVRVEVKVVTDPDSAWWHDDVPSNPQEWGEDDELAWRLWAAARGRVGLPHLDEQPSEH